MNSIPSLLFHYTTYEGLLCILRSGSLWASSIRHLNDASEFRLALERFDNDFLSIPKGASGSYGSMFVYPFKEAEAISKLREPLVFVASLSEKGDLLSQWRAYSRGIAGISIGLDTKEIMASAKTQDAVIRRCEYNSEVQNKSLNSIYSSAINSKNIPSFIEQLLQLAPTFKHETFSEESEWRFIKICTDIGSIEFRATTSLIIPFINFSLPHNGLAIRQINIGPCAYSEDIRGGVQLLLDKYKIKCAIQNSVSPYRIT